MVNRKPEVLVPPVAQRCSESGRHNPDYNIGIKFGLDILFVKISSPFLCHISSFCWIPTSQKVQWGNQTMSCVTESCGNCSWALVALRYPEIIEIPVISLDNSQNIERINREPRIERWSTVSKARTENWPRITENWPRKFSRTCPNKPSTMAIKGISRYDYWW